MTGAEQRLPRWILMQLRSWYTIPFLNERRTIEILKELVVSAERGRGEILALLALIQGNYGWNLFQAIEECKIELSSRLKAEVSFHRDLIAIEEGLTRKEFQGVIGARLREIEKEMDRTLAAAGLKADEVDVVIRTGGSSLIPAVQRMLERKFGAEKVNRQEVFTSVVQGLARGAEARFG